MITTTARILVAMEEEMEEGEGEGWCPIPCPPSTHGSKPRCRGGDTQITRDRRQPSCLV